MLLACIDITGYFSRTQTLVRQNAEVDWDRYWWKSGCRSEASCGAEIPDLLSSARNTDFHGFDFGAI